MSIWDQQGRLTLRFKARIGPPPKNIDFSLEKCRFGAKRNVSHYVLKRKRVIVAKNDNFQLEKCVKARGGRAARCMGSVPVAEMLASEARRSRASGPRQ